MPTEKVIGIDLGTTNSVVSIVEGGNPVVIPLAEGGRLLPSVVTITKEKEILVGQIAKRQAILNPERTICSIKRKMGSNYTVNIDGKKYTPQEISAFILRKLKEDAEKYLSQKITKAVITVPAYFEDAQRQATKDAGKIAGLEVLRIINEPTAAALAYGLDKDKEMTVLVFDLGGGTFDVSILELGGGVIEVKATSGNNYLGGDDFDERIVNWLIAEFKKDYGIDLSKDRTSLQRLREAAEKAKIELSGKPDTEINLPFITADSTGPKHLLYKLTRADFNKMTADLVEKTIGPTKQALSDAKLEPKDIDKILLVGGSTRIPAVQDMIKNIFGKEPSKGVNPDEAVAIGAAIQAGILAGEVKEVLLLDVTPLSLGIETLGGVFTKIIERNTTIPTKRSEIFTTAADNQPSVEIHVLQGERSMARDNKTLGKFQLVGIPPAPRGVPQIEVTFDIDVNGIVHVSAKDLGTGKEQKITITGSTNLSEEEINRMVKDAEIYAEEDRKRKEMADVKNQADTLVYTTEKTLNEHKNKLSDSERREIENAISELKNAMNTDDIERIKEGINRLTESSHKLSQIIYQQASQSTQQGEKDKGANKGKTQDGDVVDAEYEDLSNK